MRARRFVEQIYPFVSDCHTVEQYREAVNNFNTVYHRKVMVCHGQTRVVLVTSDYVVKIDYGHMAKRWGGCADEVRQYCLAFNKGYSYLFARITPYMYNECVFYIMPRIDDIDGERNQDEDVYMFLRGDENDFLNDHFADLHCANYGWKDNYPVIIDYACGY